MKINENKKEYLNKEAFRLVELLEPTSDEKTVSNYEGSIKHQIVNDWSDKLVDHPNLIYTMSYFEENVSVKECYNGQCIGFNEENFKEFQKFIAVVYKEKEIYSIASRDFIENKTLEWLLTTFKNKRARTDFLNYITDQIEVSIEEWKIYFSMLNLDIWKPLQVGKVIFEFFTKEYFDNLSNEFKMSNPTKHDNPYELMRKKYQGKVFATYIVKAERKKAKEIAFEQCALAVDVLKMCSDTTDFPSKKLSFDIDSRIKENSKEEVIIAKLSEIGSFSIELKNLPNHHRINLNDWEPMLRRQMGDFHNFLLNISPDHTELERLIINGIKRYGNAISNPNLHQRVVELFTILESLLLPDKNSPIIESVCKYCSKLVFTKPDERKRLIDLLKLMYEVRSSLIHHAKEISIDNNNLRKLQLAVIMLLATLIKKSSEHKSKHTLLQEIENAILNAY